MGRIFRTRHFTRWMRKADLNDLVLQRAVEEMRKGLIDADLGGGLVKKRIALPGRGKSAGARTLVATNHGGSWFFLFGFEKNERDNISNVELEAFKEYAKDLLRLTGSQLETLVEAGALEELSHEKPD